MKIQYFFIILLFLIPDIIYAAEVATFEAFYTESLGWTPLILASLIAVVIGAIVFFTGGLASPLVAGPTAAIGTMIGNMLGYSGIVATNVGLALLGGGSIASGGLGILGGTVVITAALTFSTELITNYAIESYQSSYNQSAFIEQSKTMVNLPLPVNKEGSESYEAVMKILQKIDKEQPLFYPNNKVIINEALRVSNKSINSEWTKVEDKKLQFITLKALLLASIGEYKSAKAIAKDSIIYAKRRSYQKTLPMFIYVLCSLYDEKIDVNKANNYFKEVILKEPDNLLIPILFAAYLDRLIYRYTSDGAVNEAHIKQVTLIAANKNIKQYAIVNLSAVMVRYFTLIKLRQQAITAIANTTNEAIRNSPKALNKLGSSMTSYNKLLKDAQQILKILLRQKLEHLDSKHKQNTINELKNFHSLMNKYVLDEERLSILVESFSKKSF
ncbi:MAG: hypothetical protein KAH84_04540 [Thiomargarita sp.]|nr:hypothetical protein [Thiomargarita sp.]